MSDKEKKAVCSKGGLQHIPGGGITNLREDEVEMVNGGFADTTDVIFHDTSSVPGYSETAFEIIPDGGFTDLTDDELRHISERYADTMGVKR